MLVDVKVVVDYNDFFIDILKECFVWLLLVIVIFLDCKKMVVGILYGGIFELFDLL